MSHEAQLAWRFSMNGGVPAAEVGRCSEIQYFFLLRCRTHLTYITPKCLKDNDNEEQGSGLRCRQCSHADGQELRKFVSQHEADAWHVVRRCFSGHMLVEIRVLGGRWGAADIWLPWSANGARLDLIIMIDGEKHFTKAWGVNLEQQKRIDKRFNQACWEQEHRLLRLYSDEKDTWEALISSALHMAHVKPLRKFQRFSSKYAQRTGQHNRDAGMDGTGHRDTGAYFQGH